MQANLKVAPLPVQAHVKAVPVNGLAQFVMKELTPDQLQSVLSGLGADARYFTGHLLAHEQVPLEVVNRFTADAATAKGEPVKAFGRRAGRFGAELGLKTVYKFIFTVLSTDFVLKKAPFMWTRVYDTGTMNVESGQGKAKIVLSDFPSEIAGCARATGWFELIGERTARDLTCNHTTCMAEGGRQCVWEFAWKA
jgi:hypothetical protein